MTLLATRPVGRLLWEYSLPAIVGMLVMALYNVVDRVFIGRVVGPEAISGMTLTFPLMNITTAIGVIVGVGSSTYISILMGRQRPDMAARTLGNAATLTVINAAAYILCFAVFMDPILRLFGASDVTLPYARTYMMWVLPGLFLTNVTFGFNNVMRATGYPTRAMFTMIIGALVNVVLDAVFVLYMGWGMKGAAIATDIAMLVSAVFVMQHFFRRDVTLSFTRGTLRLNAGIVKNVVTLGAAPSVVNFASCFINAIINRALVGHGGDMAIGAAGIFVTYTSLIVTVVLGINMGLQPIVGYNYGAGLTHRLRRVTIIACTAATIICTLGTVVSLGFPQLIAACFTTSDFLIDVTVHCLRNATWAFPLAGIPIVATAFFQSVDAPGKALFLSLTRQVLFLIPLMLWLPGRLGVTGVWLSFPISDIMACAAAVLMMAWEMRRFHTR